MVEKVSSEAGSLRTPATESQEPSAKAVGPVKKLATPDRTGSLSPNRLVMDQAEEMERDGTLNLNVAEEGSEGAAVAVFPNNDSFATTCNNLVRSLLVPKDVSEHRSFFKGIKQEPSYGQLVQFYLYHLVLVVIYLAMTVMRLYEYTCNRLKLRFLNVALSPADDPETINRDVNKLSKIPRRVSAVLTYKPEQEENGGIEGLCEDSAKIAAWTLSSGIKHLSIYEYHGLLKKRVPELKRTVFRKFVTYFGSKNVPNFTIRIPHLNQVYACSVDGKLVEDEEKEKGKDESGDAQPLPAGVDWDFHLTLLSVVDGRPTIVELTRVMAELAKKGELEPEDITVKFMDQELTQLVGKEPDMVVLFQPLLNLQGYPPWQIRLSEIYWEPDNDSTTYAVYLRALQKYSTCKINVGR